jgi:NAD(P)-dependent dehydrogenase (short-subunit alcohol dehydrogenase family)
MTDHAHQRTDRDAPTGSFRAGLFAGKTAFVCGGSSGIGAAIGSALAQLGADVTVSGATREDADAARVSSGFSGTSIALDVRDGAGVEACVRRFSRLDILVNCAGVIRRGAEHDPEVFADVIEVNLNGTMRVCAASRPMLSRSRGCIVNTASVYAFFGGGHAPGYTASKGGVAQLTKALAVAYASDGIRVNALAPGWIATALTRVVRDDPQKNGAILARTPIGRWGEPDDVAAAAVFLCSPAAAFVTGVILPVDGGYLIA